MRFSIIFCQIPVGTNFVTPQYLSYIEHLEQLLVLTHMPGPNPIQHSDLLESCQELVLGQEVVLDIRVLVRGRV